MSQRVLAAGDFLFRHRSYLPLTLIPAVVAAIAVSSYHWASDPEDLLWELAAFAVACVGLALRIWTVGVAARGTSGRNTRGQKAASLNTTGPYSLARHPLYLANGIIALGFALSPHAWLVPPFVVAATLVYYAIIARREEAFLRERFGADFAAWAARTPAWLPAWRWRRGYTPPARAFDWRIPVLREFYAVALVLIAPVVIDAVEGWLEGEPLTDVDLVWMVAAALGASLWITLRFVKKRTTWLRAPAD